MSTTFETLFGEEVGSVIRFLWAKHRVYYRLIEVYGYWLNRRASCQKMVEGRCAADSPSIWRMDVDAAKVNKLISEN
jgi:hypothetical protein